MTITNVLKREDYKKEKTQQRELDVSACIPKITPETKLIQDIGKKRTYVGLEFRLPQASRLEKMDHYTLLTKVLAEHNISIKSLKYHPSMFNIDAYYFSYKGESYDLGKFTIELHKNNKIKIEITKKGPELGRIPEFFKAIKEYVNLLNE